MKNTESELKRFERQAASRIQYLIDRYCDGNQQLFADLTGMNKASVSQYVNKKNAPSNKTAYRIAQVFNVNPAWINGFDVPVKSFSRQEEPELVFESEIMKIAYEISRNQTKKKIFILLEELHEGDLMFVLQLVKRLTM